MGMTDPIADMLTRIRNANQMRNATVIMPHSKVKEEIARILKEEGYIEDYFASGDVKKELTLTLRYVGNDRVITGLKRISKPGLRVYVRAKQMPRVLNGLGIALISTANGMLTDKEARKNNVGGEVVAYIW
ncbi:30S ribosomal protein S8 [bacterium]|jgi:small subunit ribosomal protein S8|nr:30S ribosomal protein S8 [bacterium]